MHDTFLIERIYESILKLCEDNGISRLSKIILDVNTDSHICEDSIRVHFGERKNRLIDRWTEILIERQEVGKLNAVIRSLEGESSDE